MTTVGNVGIGLIILVLVWILAVFAFITAVKFESHLGWVALGIAVLFTIVLLLIPTEKEGGDIVTYSQEDIVPDFLIYRYTTLALLIINVTILSVSFCLIYCIEPVRPKIVTTFRHVSI